MSGSPVAGWQQSVHDICAGVTRLHHRLQQAGAEDRLRLLDELQHTLARLHAEARDQAITAARAEGLPLRRIATAAGCSHEQVRHILQRRTLPAAGNEP
ncbi:helix-turn-helix domain-containing protein [Nonomuraea zeae]|uniref:Uncharacterized protein n=1 Tax=Nonomuraea zeae TaxID=1642303 RepID=A0A5S4FV42_9ACTN|nr:helix-turn-helix domain-containing protein [Nonomuraea zeae]TMR24472.1 hypothetical protein ETD85_46535 [Nonomuraea zeae]